MHVIVRHNDIQEDPIKMSTEEPAAPTTEVEAPVPIIKKAKMALPEAPFDQWPEAWIIPKEIDDQYAENRLEPNVPVTVEDLKKIGICYWKLDADSFTYPTKSVPWDPKDATDPMLKQLRDDRGYSYADIITVHPDHLPEFEKKLKAFFEEHIHDAEEIRYIVGGSGYFDVRDLNDTWVRIHVKKGDLMTLPEGTYLMTRNVRWVLGTKHV